jgi:hypothetical protein
MEAEREVVKADGTAETAALSAGRQRFRLGSNRDDRAQEWRSLLRCWWRFWRSLLRFPLHCWRSLDHAAPRSPFTLRTLPRLRSLRRYRPHVTTPLTPQQPNRYRLPRHRPR